MKYLIILMLSIRALYSSAQTVAINDPDLFTRMAYYCPAATSGLNLLNTTHPCLATITSFSTQGIGVSSLDGLQYFTGLTELYLDFGDNLSEVDMQYIPPGVTRLEIQGNNFTSLSTYPPSLEVLGINNSSINSITNLPSTLTDLGLSNIPNDVFLDAFPPALISINLNTVSISSIPPIPSSVTNISFWFTEMPTIDFSNATNITYIEIYFSQLSSIDLTGCTSLTTIGINNCTQLTALNVLPNTVINCELASNNIQTLPSSLPPSLQTLILNDNPLLANLPVFPATLQALTINNTSITCIPNRADLEANHLGTNDFDAVTFPICSNPLIFIPNTAIVDEIALLCPGAVQNQNFIDPTDGCYQAMKSLTLDFLVSDMTGMDQLTYLDSLFISQLDQVTTLDQNIPSNLVFLKMNEAYDADFINLPPSLKEIIMLYGSVENADFANSQLERLTIENSSNPVNFDYPSTIKYIDFCPYGMNWSAITTLPEGIEYMYIDTSFISCLTNLPYSLFVHIGDPNYTDLVFGDTTWLQCSPVGYLGLIPDPGFRQYINDQYPGLFSGNYLDTINPFVWNLDSMNLSGYTINDLEGIQYFKSLKHLIAPSCGIQNIPMFPDSLITIILNDNTLSSIPSIPSFVEIINVNENNLSSVPSLPSSLLQLELKNNQVTSLPAIPLLVEILRFDYNLITTIPTLPASLEKLSFSHNDVNQLTDILPALTELNAEHNQLNISPDLGLNLTYLNLGNNLLASINVLPANLLHVYLDSNSIDQIISVPSNLLTLDATSNSIDSISFSGNSVITNLKAGENPFLKINTLENSIITLDLSGTNMDSIATLPVSLNWLDLSSNSFQELPSLPNGLVYFDISDNPISCLPVLPNTAEDVFYSNTNIGCFPNYPNNPNFNDFSLTLCSTFPNSPCIGLPILRGIVFYDSNENGMKDTLEVNAANKPVLIQPGNFLAFTDSTGWYSIQVDTNTNYTISIPANFYFITVAPTGITTGGFNTIDTLSIIGIYYDSIVNDLKVNITQGFMPPRPGFTSQKHISVSSHGTDTLDISVRFKIDPLFQILEYSIQPDSVVSGTAYWNFTDFSPGAQRTIHINDSIPVTTVLGTLTSSLAEVLPQSGDYTEYNNLDTLRQEIVGSYDPNDKTANKDSILVNNVNESTINYLIRFQNTGSFPATFVVLKDTIDTKLDISTFTPIASSHDHTLQFQDRVLTVRFDNIQLADSASNEAESHGFFAYAIEPLDNLVVNDEITNTCYIYFDYNTPIITNTPVVSIYDITGSGISEEIVNEFKVWPNPANESLFIHHLQSENIREIIITDLSGKIIRKISTNNNLVEINFEDVVSGLYLVDIKTEKNNTVYKIIKN